MRRLKHACYSALAVAALYGCSPNSPPEAKVITATGVFAAESDPAAAGSLSLPRPNPIATLRPGATVLVLSDTYGKDYWACHIRTPNSQDGWVLCSSLNYKRVGGA